MARCRLGGEMFGLCLKKYLRKNIIKGKCRVGGEVKGGCRGLGWVVRCRMGGKV